MVRGDPVLAALCKLARSVTGEAGNLNCAVGRGIVGGTAFDENVVAEGCSLQRFSPSASLAVSVVVSCTRYDPGASLRSVAFTDGRLP